MREIKFRAWWNDTGNPVENFNSEYIIDSCNEEVFTVEQFTGLYDKNGREIYEGDILKNPDYEEVFFVEYHEGVAGYVGWGDDKIAGCYLITGDDIEVIGNIHENPELLEASC